MPRRLPVLDMTWAGDGHWLDGPAGPEGSQAVGRTTCGHVSQAPGGCSPATPHVLPKTSEGSRHSASGFALNRAVLSRRYKVLPLADSGFGDLASSKAAACSALADLAPVSSNRRTEGNSRTLVQSGTLRRWQMGRQTPRTGSGHAGTGPRLRPVTDHEHVGGTSLAVMQLSTVQDLNSAFYDLDGVCRLLNRMPPDVAKRVNAHELLEVITADAEKLYPVWQFTRSEVSPAALAVLHVFAKTRVDPWLIARWATAPDPRWDGQSAAQRLHKSAIAPDEVLADAQEYARRCSR